MEQPTQNNPPEDDAINGVENENDEDDDDNQENKKHTDAKNRDKVNGSFKKK
jgi:hypothetical protein